MPCSRSRNVVSVRRAKSARGMFSTGTKAALGAGAVCGGGATAREASPKPPAAPEPAGEPHLCQEIGQGQGRDGGVQVTGLVAHHHVDLLVPPDALLPGREGSGTAVPRPPVPKPPEPVPSPPLPLRGRAGVPGATPRGCHPQMPPASTHLPTAAGGGGRAPGVPGAPSSPAPSAPDLAGICFWHLTFRGRVGETGRTGAPRSTGKPRSATSHRGRGTGPVAPQGRRHGPGSLQHLNPGPKQFPQGW